MRLLLAEDEQELSRALVTVLKKNNYSVDAVYNGQDALDYIEAGNYDGAILDIMMPKMDGITVLKKARAEGISIPILMLTAKAEIDDRVTGLDAGADDYLTKPFSMKELLARIRAMTRRQNDTTDSVLKFGNITLDRATYILSSGKDSLKLANKEFQMLEMLMVNPGQVISADQFMDKIWGYDSEAEQNVVWVYISYIRKKLTAIGANVVIKAARGLGYSLEESHD
ncbi:MAG: response regulator transcription factor [Lachnospiraceae bacterium]|nr:response regulator transcription factor [Lachnospiraceae bacterium]